MCDLEQIEVLLVEDDPGDELMTREAFEDNKIRNGYSPSPRWPADPQPPARPPGRATIGGGSD